MGRKCFAPRCTTGCKSCTDKLSIFSAPKKEDRLEAWRRFIPRKDRLLQAKDFICEKHFEPRYVIKEWTAVYNGNVLARTARRAALAKDAVPTIFPKCPSYLSWKVKKRKSPAARHNTSAPMKKRALHVSGCNVNTQGPEACDVASEPCSVDDVSVPLFDQLFSSPLSVTLPSARWGHHNIDLDGLQNVVYTEVQRVPDLRCPGTAKLAHVVTTKLVDITKDMQVTVTIMGKHVSLERLEVPERLLCLEDVEKLLSDLDKLRLCGGGPSTKVYPLVHPVCASVDSSGVWRHNNCSLFLLGNKPECQNCARLSDTLRIHQRRVVNRKKESKPHCTFRFSSVPSNEKMVAFRKAKYALKRSKTRLLKKVKALTAEVRKAQHKLQTIHAESLPEKLNNLNLPSAQLNLIEECVSASKCATKKNRRYTESWLSLCLLLHIRSPSGYSFLRENDILPLPCISTVRKYLSLVRVKCGFDSSFFNAFKKMSMKDAYQRHGILVFDEVQVRKELSVNSKTMTYTGFANFGEAVKAPDELADHGLVFTFQSFGDSYSQPIAVFASKGPTKGTVLSQLVLKAIMLLEEAGTFVDALVCDGATTNRAMWTQFSVSGTMEGTSNSV